MRIITHSQQESEYLQLKVGRTSVIEKWNKEEFLKELIQHKYDVVRLRISCQDQSVFQLLHDLKIPYHVFKIMMRFEVPAISSVKFVKPELSFKLYDGTQIDDLHSVLSDLLMAPSESGYQSELYNGILNPEAMHNASMAYYISYFNRAIYQNTIQCSMAYVNDQCIGFIAYEIKDKISEGIFYGVHSAFRNTGYAHELIKSARKNSFLAGAEKFCADTIIYNNASIVPQLKVGFTPKFPFLNVNLFPMFSAHSSFCTNIKTSTIWEFNKAVMEWLGEIGMKSIVINEIKFSKEFQNELGYSLIQVRLFKFKSSGSFMVAAIIENSEYAYLQGKYTEYHS